MLRIATCVLASLALAKGSTCGTNDENAICKYGSCNWLRAKWSAECSTCDDASNIQLCAQLQSLISAKDAADGSACCSQDDTAAPTAAPTDAPTTAPPTTPPGLIPLSAFNGPPTEGDWAGGYNAAAGSYWGCEYVDSEVGLVIPDGVTEIPENMFNYCNMKAMAFPDSLKTINPAFRNAQIETAIELPSTIESIRFDQASVPGITFRDVGVRVNGLRLDDYALSPGFRSPDNTWTIVGPLQYARGHVFRLTGITTIKFEDTTQTCDDIRAAINPIDWSWSVPGNWERGDNKEEQMTIVVNGVTCPEYPVPPTAAPTEAPTEAPTAAPTEAPTEAPTAAPTEAPTPAPTEAPTATPTEAPTEAATLPTGFTFAGNTFLRHNTPGTFTVQPEATTIDECAAKCAADSSCVAFDVWSDHRTTFVYDYATGVLEPDSTWNSCRTFPDILQNPNAPCTNGDGQDCPGRTDQPDDVRGFSMIKDIAAPPTSPGTLLTTYNKGNALPNIVAILEGQGYGVGSTVNLEFVRTDGSSITCTDLAVSSITQTHCGYGWAGQTFLCDERHVRVQTAGVTVDDLYSSSNDDCTNFERDFPTNAAQGFVGPGLEGVKLYLVAPTTSAGMYGVTPGYWGGSAFLYLDPRSSATPAQSLLNDKFNQGQVQVWCINGQNRAHTGTYSDATLAVCNSIAGELKLLEPYASDDFLYEPRCYSEGNRATFRLALKTAASGQWDTPYSVVEGSTDLESIIAQYNIQDYQTC